MPLYERHGPRTPNVAIDNAKRHAADLGSQSKRARTPPFGREWSKIELKDDQENPPEKQLHPGRQSLVQLHRGDAQVVKSEGALGSEGKVPEGPTFMMPTSKVRAKPPMDRQKWPRGECTPPLPAKEKLTVKSEDAACARPGNRPTLEQVEAAKGLQLGQKAPREEAVIFIELYLARQPKHGEDYEYAVYPCRRGYVASLTVWAWSNHTYWGDPAWNDKQARVEAAKKFLADPQVIEAATLLPPPLEIVRRHFFGVVSEEHPGLPGKEKKQIADERVKEYYSKCIESGCRNAITDRRA